MLSPREIDMLRQIISLAGALISSAHPEAGKAMSKKSAKASAAPEGKRRRRTGKELADFRKMLVAERKRGVPVADLAEKHGISAAYIYQL
ncbi:MAG: hypothetical protein JWN07_2303 [Hyphomicrobiales bacterium]|nr:hypothetical protein [Hyphomicrobiales bacterium]